jgi:Glycosyl hydrolases family 43
MATHINKLVYTMVVAVHCAILSAFGAEVTVLVDNNEQQPTSNLASANIAPKPSPDGFTAAPPIRVFGDTCYVYPTSDKPHWNATELSVWSSKNLGEWEKEGVILDVTNDLKWADLQAWALDCVEHNGKYYFVWSIDDARSPDYRVGWGASDAPFGLVKTPDRDFIVLQKTALLSAPRTTAWSTFPARIVGMWPITATPFPTVAATARSLPRCAWSFNPDGIIKSMDPMTALLKPGDTSEQSLTAKTALIMRRLLCGDYS